MKRAVFLVLMFLISSQVASATGADLLVEGFEDAFPPTGWSLIHLGELYEWMWGWGGGSTGIHSANMRASHSDYMEDEWMVTEACETAGHDHLFLEFMESGTNWATRGELHEILVSTTVADDPAAFTPVWQATPDDYDVTWLNSTRAEWGRVQINLSSYLGETIYVAFHYIGTEADRWWVDDVRLYAPVDHDLTAMAVAPDNETRQSGTPFTPQFTVANTGVNTESFTATMAIEFEGVGVYHETVFAADLEPGAEVVLDFPPCICETGEFTMLATAELATDGNPEDNQASATGIGYTGQRTPLGILYTNWACGPCVAANEALDEWYPEQGDEAGLIRVHLWWPSALDPIYRANAEQSEYLHAMCPTNVTGVPTLYMDNLVQVNEDGSIGWPTQAPAAYDRRAVAGSPIEMAMTYDSADTMVAVTITVLDPMLAETYSLVVAVTEDDVYAPGSNGEIYHNQAFRRLFPDTSGQPVATAPGTHAYTIELDIDEDWVYENLRATAWVQADTTGQIINAATTMIGGGATPVAELDQAIPSSVRLIGAHPNPFNPQTTVAFGLDRSQQVTIDVINLRGQLTRRLLDNRMTAGNHSVSWDGLDTQGHSAPSGAYIIRLVAESQVQAKKVMLAR